MEVLNLVPCMEKLLRNSPEEAANIIKENIFVIAPHIRELVPKVSDLRLRGQLYFINGDYEQSFEIVEGSELFAENDVVHRIFNEQFMFRLLDRNPQSFELDEDSCSNGFFIENNLLSRVGHISREYVKFVNESEISEDQLDESLMYVLLDKYINDHAELTKILKENYRLKSYFAENYPCHDLSEITGIINKQYNIFLSDADCSVGLLPVFSQYTSHKLSSVLASGIICHGTTNDSFLRSNPDLLTSKYKTGAILALASIHKYNPSGLDVIQNYLPDIDSGEWIGLIGLSLMNLKEGKQMCMDFLNTSGNNQIAAAASLLLMNEKPIVDVDVLVQGILENVESADYACIALGLLEESEALISIKETTESERIKRVIDIALNLKREWTLETILAQINTGNPDLMREAIFELGLVCDKKSLLFMLKPLLTSHHTDVRGSAALVLGFFYSASENVEVLGLLEPLLYDNEPIVRQMACIGVGFFLVQANAFLFPDYARVINKIHSIISAKDDECARFGAIIGKSIMEASGTWVNFGITNSEGKLMKDRVVAYRLFTSYWYNYDFINFISILSVPCTIVLLDKDSNPISKTFPIKGPCYYTRTPIDLTIRKRRRKKRKAIKYVMSTEDYERKSGACFGKRELEQLGFKSYGVFYY